MKTHVAVFARVTNMCLTMIRILILLCLLIQGEKNLFSQVSAHSKVSATIVASGSTASLETPVVENAGNYALEISSFYKRTKDIMPNQPATVAFVNVAGNPHTYNIG
ncbi:MAG TPA: hypothetical protein VM368_03955, partial [Flavisolibacter sp.]|nr:hypothetical protein [Flavisolibacter sp.]